MDIEFEKTYLEELYTKGVCREKKYRFQPQVVRGYQKAIKYLISANRIEDLYPIKSLNFEALVGEKKGIFSIRANAQYRVEFVISQGEVPAITVCNILELTNHYR